MYFKYDVHGPKQNDCDHGPCHERFFNQNPKLFCRGMCISVSYMMPYNIDILRRIFHRIQITMKNHSWNVMIWYNPKLFVNCRRDLENDISVFMILANEIYQALNRTSCIVLISIVQIKIRPKHVRLIWSKNVCDDIKLLYERIMLICAH